jgi:dTDP-4-dehydrorhamnose reductase
MQFDLTSFEAVNGVMRRIQPDVVIHTVGLTSVEGCEADPGPAHRLNVESAHYVAKVANTLGARLVHISTDHLYDGASPWQSEEDTPCPLNTYAKTKLQAEEAVIQACPEAMVLRTNFYGWGTSVRTSFSDWILKSLEQGRELTMFSDVFFTPILINDLAQMILRLVDGDAKGIFNVAGRERLSKYDFALKLAEVFNRPRDKIRATTVKEFPFKARRPEDMSLSSKKVEDYLGARMPATEDGLKRLKDLELAGHRSVLEGAVRKGLSLSRVLSAEE